MDFSRGREREGGKSQPIELDKMNRRQTRHSIFGGNRSNESVKACDDDAEFEQRHEISSKNDL